MINDHVSIIIHIIMHIIIHINIHIHIIIIIIFIFSALRMSPRQVRMYFNPNRMLADPQLRFSHSHPPPGKKCQSDAKHVYDYYYCCYDYYHYMYYYYYY